MSKIQYFNLPIIFGYCDNKKAFEEEFLSLGWKKKEIPAFKSKGADATTHTFINNDNDKVIIVCYDREGGKNKKRHEIIGLMIHEAAHVVDEVLDYFSSMKADNDHANSPIREQEIVLLQVIAQSLIGEALKKGEKE